LDGDLRRGVDAGGAAGRDVGLGAVERQVGVLRQRQGADGAALQRGGAAGLGVAGHGEDAAGPDVDRAGVREGRRAVANRAPSRRLKVAAGVWAARVARALVRPASLARIAPAPSSGTLAALVVTAAPGSSRVLLPTACQAPPVRVPALRLVAPWTTSRPPASE